MERRGKDREGGHKGKEENGQKDEIQFNFAKWLQLCFSCYVTRDCVCECVCPEPVHSW